MHSSYENHTVGAKILEFAAEAFTILFV